VTFPGRFLFGTATAATQIEGGCTTTDWWEFSREPGRIANGDTTAVACDHWHRVREDIALQTRLGMGAYRMSVEWGRIEPEEGRFDETVLEHYRDEVRALRDAGIEPMVTLHHFSFPTWLGRVGGAIAPQLPERFERFTRHVVRVLGDYVATWITINEPNVLVAQGYLLGIWPPGKPSLGAIPRAIRNLRRAHRHAYRAIHDIKPGASVGIAHHIRLATPASADLRDRVAARLLDVAFNRPFLDLPQDFIGLNYYSRDIVRFAAHKAGELFMERTVALGADTNDLGWEIYPEGLGIVLRSLAKKRKPIWITENGIADAADTRRAKFIALHLREVESAIEDGVDVRGYLHWSLLDNFEWADGYAARFGLYAVDATQTRTLRASGEAYAALVRQRSL
jgi:beta-glucosidase